jgi:hypothetical protein
MNTRFYQIAIVMGLLAYLVFHNDLTVYYPNALIALAVKCVPFFIIMVMYPVATAWVALESKKHQRTKHNIALFVGVPFYLIFTYVSLTYYGIMHTIIAFLFISFYLLSAYAGVKRYRRKYAG